MHFFLLLKSIRIPATINIVKMLASMALLLGLMESIPTFAVIPSHCATGLELTIKSQINGIQWVNVTFGFRLKSITKTIKMKTIKITIAVMGGIIITETKSIFYIESYSFSLLEKIIKIIHRALL